MPNPAPPQPVATIAHDLVSLHNRLHTLFTWAATIELSLRLNGVEISVYWRNTNSESFVSRQKLPLGDVESHFDYAANLLRQAYLQSMGGKA